MIPCGFVLGDCEASQWEIMGNSAKGRPQPAIRGLKLGFCARGTQAWRRPFARQKRWQTRLCPANGPWGSKSGQAEADAGHGAPEGAAIDGARRTVVGACPLARAVRRDMGSAGIRGAAWDCGDARQMLQEESRICRLTRKMPQHAMRGMLPREDELGGGAGHTRCHGVRHGIGWLCAAWRPVKATDNCGWAKSRGFAFTWSGRVGPDNRARWGPKPSGRHLCTPWRSLRLWSIETCESLKHRCVRARCRAEAIAVATELIAAGTGIREGRQG